MTSRASTTVTVLISALLMWVNSESPDHYVIWLTANQTLDLSFFVLCCVLTIWIAEGYRRTLSRMREQQRQLDLLTKELKHRARNTIAVAQAIVTNSLRGNQGDADRTEN